MTRFFDDMNFEGGSKTKPAALKTGPIELKTGPVGRMTATRLVSTVVTKSR